MKDYDSSESLANDLQKSAFCVWSIHCPSDSQSFQGKDTLPWSTLDCKCKQCDLPVFSLRNTLLFENCQLLRYIEVEASEGSQRLHDSVKIFSAIGVFEDLLKALRRVCIAEGGHSIRTLEFPHIRKSSAPEATFGIALLSKDR